MNPLRAISLLACLAIHAASAEDAKKPEPPFVTQPKPITPAPASDKTPRAPTPPAIEAPEKKAPAPPAAVTAPAPQKETAPQKEVAAQKPPAANATPSAPRLAVISTELGGRDLQFLQSAAEVGRLQAWLGEQAKTRAQTDQVKAVGDALQATHADESQFLARLAKAKGIAADVSGVPARQRLMSVELEKLNGPKFEKSVMERIVEVGQEMVSIYESATQSRDADIKRFAEQMLPLAKEKLQLASRISGSAPRSPGAPSFRGEAGPSAR